MSDRTREQRALAVFDAALDLPAGERRAHIDRTCGDDPALHAHVLALLAADDGDDGILTGLPPLDADAEADPAHDPWLGRSVGPWRLQRLLGRGGMGAVYLAERSGDFSQQAALKLIRLDVDSGSARTRFQQERRILAGLQHPGIAALLDGGVSEQGVPYFAMQHVDGERIDRWCDARRLGIHERVTLFLQVLDAVQYAHRNLVVHRDLKPANVLVDADGRPKLLDFGIAKLVEEGEAATRTRERALTPEYAAPEQLGGDAITTATDVYQLGLMLHALLAGRHAFAITAETPIARQLEAMRGEPQTLAQSAAAAGAEVAAARALAPAQLVAALRGDLSAIVAGCLQRAPERRYGSVEALARDLQRWQRGLPVSVRAASRSYRWRAFVRRNKGMVATVAAVIAALASGLGLALWQAGIARQQAAIARGERDRAIAEAARSEAVRGYLQFMFRDTAASDRIDPKAALKQAVERIARRFADDPASGQATALALAQMYLGLGDVDAAQPLIAQVLSWPHAGNDADVRAQALQAQAQMGLLKGDVAAGLAAHAQADAIWAADPARYAAVRNEGQTVLGALQRKGGRLEASIATLRAAVAQRRDLLKLHDSELANLLGELCNSELMAGQLQAADADCRAALAVHERLGSTQSAVALAVRNALAMGLVKQQKLVDAAEELGRLHALHSSLYGGQSRDSCAIETNLANVLGKLGRIDEALAHARHAAGVLAPAGAPASPLGFAATMALADILLLHGDHAEAERQLHAAAILLDALPALRPLASGKLARSRAAVAAASGRRAEALRQLALAEAAFKALGPAGEPDLQTLAALRARHRLP